LLYIEKLKEFIASLSSDLESIEKIYAFRMFNEGLLFKRTFAKPLDHIKYRDRANKSDDVLNLIFEYMKNPDWLKVLGVSYSDMKHMTSDEVSFLNDKLKEFRVFRERKTNAESGKLENLLKGENGGV
jgi:hypothetical protein